MKEHTNTERAFHWSSKAWYHDPATPHSISVGMYSDGGGTTGEFTVEWVDLAGKRVPQLKVFDDAWSALSTFKDLLDKLSEVDDDNITEDEFVNILLSCGFKDLTAYKSPYDPPETKLRLELTKLEERAKEIRVKLSSQPNLKTAC